MALSVGVEAQVAAVVLAVVWPCPVVSAPGQAIMFTLTHLGLVFILAWAQAPSGCLGQVLPQSLLWPAWFDS